MRTAISWLLRLTGIHSTATREALAPQILPPVMRGPGSQPLMVRSGVPVSREDRKRAERKVEPAMVVIPRDDVQMPPRAAAPGLPPVDPVERPYPMASEIGVAGRSRPPSGLVKASRDGESSCSTGPRPACDKFFSGVSAYEDG